MVNTDPALSHHLFELTQAQWIGHVPTHAHQPRQQCEGNPNAPGAVSRHAWEAQWLLRHGDYAEGGCEKEYATPSHERAEVCASRCGDHECYRNASEYDGQCFGHRPAVHQYHVSASEGA